MKLCNNIIVMKYMPIKKLGHSLFKLGQYQIVRINHECAGRIENSVTI